jgi:hypothetical protein
MSLLIMPFSFRGRHCCLNPFVAILLFLAGKLSNIFCTAKILNVDFFVKRGWRKCMQERKGCLKNLFKKILRKEIGKKLKILFVVRKSRWNFGKIGCTDTKKQKFWRK